MYTVILYVCRIYSVYMYSYTLILVSTLGNSAATLYMCMYMHLLLDTCTCTIVTYVMFFS